MCRDLIILGPVEVRLRDEPGPQAVAGPALQPARRDTGLGRPGPQDKARRIRVQGNLTDPEEVVRVSAQHNATSCRSLRCAEQRRESVATRAPCGSPADAEVVRLAKLVADTEAAVLASYQPPAATLEEQHAREPE